MCFAAYVKVDFVFFYFFFTSADDAEDMGGENPYASLVAENESLYIDDPKKALKGFYDREGELFFFFLKESQKQMKIWM